MINLVTDTINNSDIDQLINWLKTYPHLTKGKITEEYEQKWSNYLGRKYSVFVNSGSSANLIMLYALIASKEISVGDQVIVPTLAWATDIAPVVQLGLDPILCDCNLNDLSIDLEHFESLCQQYRPKALLLVSVLGLVPNMEKVVNLCKKYDIILLEDVCESLGSEGTGSNKLGTYGFMSTFSTYFGHHISTIEGGMVCTDDIDIYNVLKSLRSHGWDRDLDPNTRATLREKYNVSEFSGLYTFYYPGFNLRSTDLQAFIGLAQLDKLSGIVNRRHTNFNIYRAMINTKWKPTVRVGEYISNFAYPVIHKNRDEIVKALQQQDIAVRPLICGSMNKQPAYMGYLAGKFPNAEEINEHGFYIPNHPGLSFEDLQLVYTIINNNI